jgi:hypothetical protein
LKKYISGLPPNNVFDISLMIFGPFSDIFKVLALVIGTEVDPRSNIFNPPLTEYACIRCAHELLPQDVKTMTYP